MMFWIILVALVISNVYIGEYIKPIPAAPVAGKFVAKLRSTMSNILFD